MSDIQTVTGILSKLVSFDTTSRDSNLELIEWVENFVAPYASDVKRIPNEEGTKANLWIRFGAEAANGIVLSGHSDVVPVDGQPWSSEPFELTPKEDGRLYGRGTCDMKGFLALALAFAPELAKMDLKRPVYIAISYDEEIGCAGVESMIEDLTAQDLSPSICWVGEPTLWNVVTGHKGICVHEVIITGMEGHSSLPDLAASATHEAIDLMALLRSLSKDLKANPPAGSQFTPPEATLTIGVINGGTASNIIARECNFYFDLRCPPGVVADEVLQPFYQAVMEADARLKTYGEYCGVELIRHSNAPPLSPETDGPAEQLARQLTGDNGTHLAGYCAEAGQFQQAGLSTIICGPGSIEQAHQPDEYVAVSELETGVKVLKSLFNTLV